MPDSGQSAFASASLARHLGRGVIGFGLLSAALCLAPSLGPLALALAIPGVLVMRGCPMCWTVGLIETISAGRLKPSCAEDGCTVRAKPDGEAGEAPMFDQLCP